MSAAIIEAAHLGFAYEGARPVFEGLSLRLEAGERLGLTGPNGSGKSSLLHVLVGLLPAAAGSISVCGRSVATEADFAEVRRTVGLSFQDADDQLFCPTVLEDVAFGPLNLGKSQADAAATARDALARVGLGGFEERVTYRLSGGEKRLVALAGVLAMEPRVLLLDEPSAGLDEAAETRLAELLVTLPQEMIVVSHNAAFLARVTHRRVAMADLQAPKP